MSTKAPLSRKLWLHDDVIKIQRSKANIFEGTSCAFFYRLDFFDWIRFCCNTEGCILLPFQLTTNPKKYAQLLVNNEVLIQSDEKGIKVKKEKQSVYFWGYELCGIMLFSFSRFGNSVSIRLGRLQTVSFSANYQPEKTRINAPESFKKIRQEVCTKKGAEICIFEGTSYAAWKFFLWLTQSTPTSNSKDRSRTNEKTKI